MIEKENNYILEWWLWIVTILSGFILLIVILAIIVFYEPEIIQIFVLLAVVLGTSFLSFKSWRYYSDGNWRLSKIFSIIQLLFLALFLTFAVYVALMIFGLSMG